MAPGGIERSDPGQLFPQDLERARTRLGELMGRSGAARQTGLVALKRHTEHLDKKLREAGGGTLVYVDEDVYALEPRLRSAALEIDFTFGDEDGRLSPSDLHQARYHYGQVRGPVGWNRLLLTDEIERRLFPERTLRTTRGLKLLPEDWVGPPDQPLARLEKVSRYLDDAALARTYADIAARFAVAPEGESAKLFENALALLGQEIRGRGSVKPSITDIARIGCEDPDVKASLPTPIEMSRRLSPAVLLDRFLS